MSWTCPYCNHPTTVTDPNEDKDWINVKIAENNLGYKSRVGFYYLAVACPNEKCKKLFFKLVLGTASKNRFGDYEYAGKDLNTWQLLPESSAKPQPSYIPKQIIEDYTEACKIKDLSPKASATLSRRCLQGMIRDFWSISVKSGKLADEISELEDKVSTPEWEAIDAIRSVGNVGKRC
jgi:hypothetical protein